ncbi:hypothetical protein ABH900_003540 [Stenotrophomonas sp. AN71]|uniref:hypothetical protein n=1 Tax=Stenotrophomonas TaxID=40323 RepID=UPI001070CCC8|nr:hypothetical protein [Stenotrophomonas indicatrix]QBR44169.1 hypothetical protein DAIF1_17320 [Stenotrophomonas indicatrix]
MNHNKCHASRRATTITIVSIAAVALLGVQALQHPIEMAHAPLAGLCALVAAWASMVLPGIALASISKTKSWGSSVTVLVGSGTVGMLNFWAWFTHPALGWYLGIAVIVLSIAVVILRGLPRSAIVPAALSLTIAIFYFAIAADHGISDDAQGMVAARYWAQVDNKLPQFAADQIQAGRDHLRGFTTGDWLTSDRPPLQTGMILPVYSAGDTANRELLGLVAGIAANSIWVFGLWALLGSLNVTRRHAFIATASVAMIGSTFVNGVYVWPKLLAGAFGLGLAAIAVRRNDAPVRDMGLMGALAALGLLAHGGVIFWIVGVAAVAITRSRLRIAPLTTAFAVGIVLFLPWLLFQKHFAPPADRLPKWHLAGQVEITQDSLLSTIRNNYAKLGLSGVAQAKLDNLKILLGTTRLDIDGTTKPAQAWVDDPAAEIRRNQFLFVGTAPMIALLGLLALFNRSSRPAWLRPLATMVGASSVAFILIEFGGNPGSQAWLVCAPMSLYFAWAVIGPLALAPHRILSVAMTIGLAASFWTAWVWKAAAVNADPHYVLGPPNYAMIAIYCATGLLLTAAPIVLAIRCDRHHESSTC